MVSDEVIAFFTYLAIERNVALNTLSQALNSLIFLYKQVLNQSLESINEFIRPRKKTTRCFDAIGS